MNERGDLRSREQWLQKTTDKPAAGRAKTEEIVEDRVVSVASICRSSSSSATGNRRCTSRRRAAATANNDYAGD